MQIDKLLSVSIIAKRLECSSRQVRQLIYAGKLKASNIGTSTERCLWRVPESEVIRFLDINSAINAEK